MASAGLLLSALVLVSSVATSSASSIDFDAEKGMFLARGYDSLSGEVRGDCVERTEAMAPAGANAQKVTFSTSQIESYNSLARQTGLSASAGLTLGAGSANGKVAFLQTINVNDYSLYVLAQVSVMNASSSMTDMSLKQNMSKLLTEQGPDAFRKLCGDMFVSGLTTGGEMYSVIEIATHSDEEKKIYQLLSVAAMGSSAGQLRFRTPCRQ